MINRCLHGVLPDRHLKYGHVSHIYRLVAIKRKFFNNFEPTRYNKIDKDKLRI